MTIEQHFATRTNRMKASEIRELLKLLDRPGILSFAGGIPDADLFPAQAFADACAEILAHSPGAALQYSVTEGYLPLRQWIAEQMSGIGIPCGPANILITSGSQQALDYLGKLFLSPGDTALVGWPTYLGALGAFNAYEPRYDRLDLTTNSPAQHIRATAQETGSPVKFAYLSPDFANPTGETVNRAQREHLLDMAEDLDCAIIEDAAYQALRYDGEDVPAILALELAQKGDLDACRTIYCGSFSKTLSPGLRIGWVVAAQPIIKQLVLMKQAADLHSPTLNQMALHHVAQRCFGTHLPTVRTAYRHRRDAMLDALARHMPPGVTWTHPEGGMFIWLTLPETISATRLLSRAIDNHDLAFVPGRAFFADGTRDNTLRLSFSCTSPETITDGMQRLAKAIRTT